ncbi:MAG TPA: iron-sulfur cluster repair di-iron protein [Holophaga sp.]|nr:iron-sulfur cluster repair di-iron protein [Holophaga sp.]
MRLIFESTQRIGDIVLERPAAMRVFERLDLDYCCGGHRTLAEAAELAGRDLGEVQAALEADESPATSDPRALAAGSLRELIDHIEATHHVFTRSELARVAPLVEKVAQVHGDRHPELAAVRELFLTLEADLLPHLEKEERILFPYIRTLEGGATACEACFGTVRGPVSVMQAEHEEAGEVLRRLRALTNGYQAPEDGCATYRSMLMGLEALEADLHLHIYLESHILFPGATALEDANA